MKNSFLATAAGMCELIFNHCMTQFLWLNNPLCVCVLHFTISQQLMTRKSNLIGIAIRRGANDKMK